MLIIFQSRYSLFLYSFVTASLILIFFLSYFLKKHNITAEAKRNSHPSLSQKGPG